MKLIGEHMSDQVVKIKLVLNAEGIKKAEDDLRKLNKLKQQAETMGGSAGPKSAAFKGAEYGTARGTIGTGAEGRDFAKQSQGLGGIVRLYATVAANLFAVTAAFNALKDAMATTNMIQGLNQLGAQSGQSLGSLAKNFADASGGAISLRDAMQATVQATSAGLSAKQFSQLGEVAKKASLALGRDMPEAVSRLTRGITKLEPELLDELGIFTKVGKATEDYAKSVGKSVASLTDFEKRQAYANAALEEGLTKFGAIDIAANPYDKLSASLKNLAQTGLEAVNKVLGPLVDLLSSSPQALTVAIGAISALLLKQAIPAIGQYRDSLKDAAERSKQAAAFRATESARAAEKEFATRENPLDVAAEKALANKKVAEAAVTAAKAEVKDAKDSVKKALKEIDDARASGFTKGTRAALIFEKGIKNIDENDRKYLQSEGEKYRGQGKDAAADRYLNAAKALDVYSKAIQTRTNVSAAGKAAIKALEGAEKEYATAVTENNKKLEPGLGSPAARAALLAKRTADISASKSIISGAAESTATIGAVGAWTEMRKNVKESDMGPIRKGFTTISAAASIASTSIIGIVSALQTWIFIIGGVVAGIKIFDAWMTKNAEQAEAYKKALSSSEESLKNYDRTLAALSKTAEKNGGAIFSAAGITAQANAFKELSDSLGTLREKFEEVTKATKGWDKFWDGVFSKSQADTFAQTSVATISKLIADIDSPELAETLTKDVSRILGTTGDSQLEWIDALKKGGPEAAKAIKLIEERINGVSTALNITASRSNEFNDQLKKLGESYRAFAFSVIDKSPMSALGDDLIAFSVKSVGAFVDIKTGLASITKLMEDSTKLGMFSPETFAEMQKMKSEVESLNKVQGESAIKLRVLRQEETALRLQYDTAKSVSDSQQGVTGEFDTGAGAPSAKAISEAKQKLDETLTKIAEANAEVTSTNERVAELMASPVFKNLAVEAFQTGTKLITQGLDDAFKKGTIEISRASVGLLGDLPGTADIVREIDRQDLAIQISQLDLMAQMVRAQNLTVAAQYQTTAAVALEKAQQTKVAATSQSVGLLADTDPASIALESAKGLSVITEKFDEFINSGGTGQGGAAAMLEALIKAMNTVGKESAEAAVIIGNMFGVIKSFQSIAATRAGLETKDTLSENQKRLNIIKEQKFVKDQELSVDEAILATQRTGVAIMGQQNAFQTKAQAGAQAQVASQSAIFEFRRKSAALDAEEATRREAITNLEGKNLPLKETPAQVARDIAIKRANAESEKANKLAEAGAGLAASLIKLLAEEEARRLNIRQIIADTNNIRDTTTNELNELELEYQIKLGNLSDQQIADSKNLIETTKIETEARSKLISLELNYLASRNKLMADFKSAAPGEAGDAIRQNAQAEMEANAKKYAVEVEGVNSVTAAKLKMKELDASISERQKAYEDIFKKTFEGMGDAIVDFVKTGKLEFSSLISSMLEDLVRYELKQQAMALYQSAKTGMGGAGGIASFLSNLIPGMGGSSGGAIETGSMLGPNSPGFAKGGAFDSGVEKYAQGGAFDYSIEKYAKGGMFTNQIVDSPTLFKFAKGTGMMGEAGPEAIMPLKRDSQGNLGVRSGQQQTSVDVVVNNYGNEPATATETTDSRGNRKIEVTIGDMNAAEVSRSGSTSQRSLKSTYGLQPQLIRR